MSQLISAFAADNFVPGIATQARAAVASSPSANTAMRLLLTGFKLAGGSMATGTISGPVTSEAQCDEIVAVGSELSRMFRAARARTKDVEVWLGCVAEPSGAQAFARLTISGTWSTAGSFTIYVDGDPLIVEIGASDATTAVATAIDAANALYPSLSYTTAVDGSSVDLTKNNKGTRGNSSILYVDTTNAPSGLVVTLEPPLGELVTLTAELRADFLAHIVLTTGTVHGAADVEIYAMGAAPTNHATAIARLASEAWSKSRMFFTSPCTGISSIWLKSQS